MTNKPHKYVVSNFVEKKPSTVSVPEINEQSMTKEKNTYNTLPPEKQNHQKIIIFFLSTSQN